MMVTGQIQLDSFQNPTVQSPSCNPLCSFNSFLSNVFRSDTSFLDPIKSYCTTFIARAKNSCSTVATIPSAKLYVLGALLVTYVKASLAVLFGGSFSTHISFCSDSIRLHPPASVNFSTLLNSVSFLCFSGRSSCHLE